LFEGSKADLVYKDPVVDDPKQRRPDITLAKNWLNWEPKVNSQLFSVKQRNTIIFLLSDFVK